MYIKPYGIQMSVQDKARSKGKNFSECKIL